MLLETICEISTECVEMTSEWAERETEYQPARTLLAALVMGGVLIVIVLYEELIRRK